MLRFGPFAALTSALAIAGCASSGTTRAYVAPTSDTVFPSIEESPGVERRRILSIENRSTVPILVYSVTLRGCENIKEQCDTPRRLNVRVRPGQRSPILTVDVRDVYQPSTFRYTYGWRADSAHTAAMSALAENGSDDARRNLEAIRRAEEAQRAQVGVHDERLTLESINALGARVAGIIAEPDSFVLKVGETVPLEDIRILVIATDGERLGRARNVRFRFRPGPMAFVQPAAFRAVAPGRVAVDFELSEGALPDREPPIAPASVIFVVRE